MEHSRKERKQAAQKKQPQASLTGDFLHEQDVATPEDQILRLQQTIGNAAVQRLVDTGEIRKYVNVPKRATLPPGFMSPKRIQRAPDPKDSDKNDLQQEDEPDQKDQQQQAEPTVADGGDDTPPDTQGNSTSQVGGTPDAPANTPSADVGKAVQSVNNQADKQNETGDKAEPAVKDLKTTPDDGDKDGGQGGLGTTPQDAAADAAPPAPVPIPYPNISMGPANPLTDYATTAITRLQAQAEAQQAAITETASSGRAGLQTLFETARSQSTERIDAIRSQVLTAIETTIGQVDGASAEQQSSFQGQAQEKVTQIQAQQDKAQTDLGTMKTEKSAQMQQSLQKKAGEADKTGKSKAGQQSGILGKLKAKAFVQVGAKLMNKILGGLGPVVGKLTQFIGGVAHKVTGMVTQIVQGVMGHIAKTLKFLLSAAGMVKRKLRSLATKIASFLLKIAKTVSRKLVAIEKMALQTINEAELEARSRIHEAYLQGDAIIKEAATIAIPDDPNDPKALEAMAILRTQIDQVEADATAVMGAVYTQFGSHVTSVTGEVQGAVTDALAELEGDLAAVASNAQSQLTKIAATHVQAAGQAASTAVAVLSEASASTAQAVTEAVGKTKEEADKGITQSESKVTELATSEGPYSAAATKTEAWYNKNAPAEAKQMEADGQIQRVIQRAPEKQSWWGRFWSGVKKSVGGLLQGLGMLLGGVLGTLVLAAIAAFIPGVGPFIAAGILVAGAVALGGLLIYGLWTSIAKRWTQMTKAGVPTWLAVITIPFIGFVDFVGILPLMEGLAGRDLVYNKLTAEQRGEKISMGAISLILTLATAGLGKAAQVGAKGGQAARLSPGLASKVDEVANAAKSMYRPIGEMMKRFGQSKLARNVKGTLNKMRGIPTQKQMQSLVVEQAAAQETALMRQIRLLRHEHPLDDAVYMREVQNLIRQFYEQEARGLSQRILNGDTGLLKGLDKLSQGVRAHYAESFLYRMMQAMRRAEQQAPSIRPVVRASGSKSAARKGWTNFFGNRVR